MSKDETDPSMDSNVKKPTMLEFIGLAGNFGHLNCRDPFDVKKRGSSYVTEIRAGVRVWSLYRAGWAKLHLTVFFLLQPPWQALRRFLQWHIFFQWTAACWVWSSWASVNNWFVLQHWHPFVVAGWWAFCRTTPLCWHQVWAVQLQDTPKKGNWTNLSSTHLNFLMNLSGHLNQLKHLWPFF